MTETNGPLSGVRVVDLTRVLAGPYCTQLLGDLGADVIKIERPGSGDDTRRFAPPFLADADGNDTSESAYFMSANRNKRSVALDISKPEGQEIVKKLKNENLDVRAITLGINLFDCVSHDIDMFKKNIRQKIIVINISLNMEWV